MSLKQRTISLVLMILIAVLLVQPQVSQAETGTTYAAFQDFLNGYMIWRSDNGGIWVLANLGCTATYFPQSSYENLPDNPVLESPPGGLVKPASGFGRVWGNFRDVGSQLGWALSPEQGYTVTFAPTNATAGGLKQERVNIPDGRQIVIREDNTWGWFGAPRPISCLPASTTIPASMQTFEHGTMLWWSETGSIWVLYADGKTALYESQSYGRLPDNPVSAVPPAGLVKPILGFGKVWGNNPAVRQGLGWATGGERGYPMSFKRTLALSTVGGSAVTFVVNDPSGRLIVIRDNGTWAFA